MADKPILFSGQMVRAILDGRKTQTRRVLKPQPGPFDALFSEDGRWWDGDSETGEVHSYWNIPLFAGDRLWVRETHGFDLRLDAPGGRKLKYRATNGLALSPESGWKPSIHMPRTASRLTLTVTDVRVQRLQEISEIDGWAEGCKRGDQDDTGGFWPAEQPHPKGGTMGWDCARDWFADLWDSLNASRGFGWDANPWVAAYTFTVQRGNIDQMEAA